MSRGLPAALVTAIDGQVVRPVTFVELAFDAPTGTQYIHDSLGNLTADDWDGVSRTWAGVGDLGGVEGLEEGLDVSPFAATLILSGLSATIASSVLTDDTVLRTVRILIGALDESRALVSDPHPWWSGLVDDQQVSVGSENIIRMVCESHLAAFQRVNGRMFNDADLQDEFAGDLGFQYLPQVLDAKVVWGGDVKSYQTGRANFDGVFGPGPGGGGGSGGFGGFGNFDQR